MRLAIVVFILALASAAQAATGILIVQRIVTSAQSAHSEWLCLYALDNGGYHSVVQPIARGVCADTIVVE